MKQGIVVPHTHWDREWYQPFQGFRSRLVYMVDELIETLESDATYEHFFFDGQTIVLEDYLQARPQMKERLTNLIADGRIGVGPWYDMPDEFLVSGEALVRNLMKGVRMAESFGAEAVRCGYACDLFGHNSQFPQILTGFGIPYAVIARGFADNAVPAEVYWESPDGSRVMTAKLDAERSYSDLYFAVRWPFDGRDYDENELADRMEKHLRHKDSIQASSVYLLLEGVDHMEIEPKLPWIVETLNRRIDGVSLRIGSLDDYFSAIEAGGEYPVVYGEQIEPGRRGLNNQVLSNVWSSRVDLKRRNDECQELLEQWAEPLAVWQAWLSEPAGGGYPADFLRLAWEYLLKNHPHDSICGCSVGQVHRDMHYRFDQSALIAEDLVQRAMTALVDAIDTQSLPGGRAVTLFNSSDGDAEQVYEFDLAFADDEEWENIALYGAGGSRIPYQRLSVRREIKSVHRKGRLIQFLPLRFVRVAAAVRIPARGYTTVAYENLSQPPVDHGQYTVERWVEPVRYPGSLRTGPATVDTGPLEVSVDGTGHLTILHKPSGHRFRGLLAIEDSGEIGDGWNHRPPLHDTVVTSRAAHAAVSILHDGPALAAFHIRLELAVPRSIAADGCERSTDIVSLLVEHEVTLRAGSPRIDVATTIHNTVEDHMVTVLFPTGLDTEGFATDTPFDIVERSFERPDRSDYVEPDTGVHPSQGFMRIQDSNAGMAVFTRGIYEYRARPGKERTMALTLMRCFSKEVGTHGGTDGQLPGVQRFAYALRFFSPEETGLYAEYRAYKAGIKQQWSLRHAGTHPTEGWFVRHQNSEVVVSALKRAEDQADSWILRLWNTTDLPQSDTIQFTVPIRSVERSDLNERPQGKPEQSTIVVDDGLSSMHLELLPKKIVTFRLNL